MGESEFECGVKGNLHIKAHCRGRCQFFRLAREKYAQMVVLQADGCQLVLLRGENIELVQPGTVYDMREVAGMDEITSNAKFAVREHHQLDFLVRELYEGEYARDTRRWELRMLKKILCVRWLCIFGLRSAAGRSENSH